MGNNQRAIKSIEIEMANGESSSKEDFPGEKQDSTGPSSKRPKLDAAEVKAMSAKQYMDELIVPTLLKGLSACNKQRPIDPVEFLAHYLLEENNKLPKATEETSTEMTAS